MNRSLKSLLVVAALFALPALAKNDALSLVPNDAVSVGVVRLADLRTSPRSMTLFEQTDKVGANGESDRFLDDAGLDPKKDVDVLVVSMSPRTALGTEADVLVAAEGRFNVDRLTKALLARGATQKNGYLLMPQELSESGHRGAIAFASSSLVVMGNESAVAEALASRANGGTSFLTTSGLGRETARSEARASAWAIVDVAPAQRLTGTAKVPQKNAALGAALKNVSTVALWATDKGDSLALGGFGLARDEATLQLVEDTLRGALAAMRLAVQEKAPDMVSVLRKFTVTRNEESVSISGTIPAAELKKLTEKTRLHAEK